MGIQPLTFNKILPRLNNVAGMEVQTRTKVTFRARSYDKKEKDTAEALSDLAMFVQDKNNSTHILSHVGHDARVCGLGWHEFDVQDGVIREGRSDPLLTIPDLADRTPGLTEQRFVGKGCWMPKDLVKQKWSDADVDAAQWGFAMPFGGEAYCPVTTCGGYMNDETQMVFVVEWSMRIPAKYYEVIDRSNRLVTTFDKAEAKAIAARPQYKNITEKQGYKIVFVYFTGNVLLEVLEDSYQLNPAKGLFLLTPTVCFRDNDTGAPFGLVRNAIDPQRRYNKTKTRLTWLMAAHQVIMDGDAADAQSVRDEAARPDGVLVVKAGKQLNINRHEQAIAQHLAALDSDDKDIQAALGIYDESLGIETNANSGIAIQKRQLGSSRNMAMVIDNALAAKKRWAEKLLYLIQSVFTEQTAFWVMDDAGEVKQLVLNQPELDAQGNPVKDKNGRPVLKYDIKTPVYDTYVEEVPDVASQQEVARDMVIQALPSIGGLQNLTPGFLELLGVPQTSKLMQEVTDGVPQKLAAANAAAEAAAKNSVGGLVPTNTPQLGAPIAA
ncbi:hypothetical protein [Bradyrhizobium manausense]|uniref:portal protein n=1 Tax=Bradyrhizobium manausense TaxID=989370 RepID=UPI001BAB1B0D|nr:hypothetical protein [Bradyrhizobium manausense]MBR0721772.1 hypothetical protein [Bradyrhizobium manausense]